MLRKIIFLVDRKDVLEGETLRFIEKICRSAGISEGSYVLSYLRPGVLERLKEVEPAIIVAFGSIVSRTLLGKQDFTCSVGLAHESPWGTVVPLAHPGKLLRGKMGEIEKTVQTLMKCRKHLEEIS